MQSDFEHVDDWMGNKLKYRDALKGMELEGLL
jgi:hypothetical protein